MTKLPLVIMGKGTNCGVHKLFALKCEQKAPATFPREKTPTAYNTVSGGFYFSLISAASSDVY